MNLLTVEAKVLGEGLRSKQLHSLPDHLSHGPGISVDIPSGKSLVGCVHQWENTLLLQHREVAQTAAAGNNGCETLNHSAIYQVSIQTTYNTLLMWLTNDAK